MIKPFILEKNVSILLTSNGSLWIFYYVELKLQINKLFIHKFSIMFASHWNSPNSDIFFKLVRNNSHLPFIIQYQVHWLYLGVVRQHKRAFGYQPVLDGSNMEKHKMRICRKMSKMKRLSRVNFSKKVIFLILLYRSHQVSMRMNIWYIWVVAGI